MKNRCMIFVVAALLLLTLKPALADWTPGLVLNMLPSQSTGALWGGSKFKVRVGSTVGVVNLSVSTKDSLECYLENRQLVSGGETTLVIVPTKARVGDILTATVTARSGANVVRKMVKVKIVNAGDLKSLEPIAVTWRDAALGYLRAEHPDFASANGLDKDVDWKGYAEFPQLFVVSHYHFRWGDWHAYVLWHVMVPPHDWKRVLLSNKKENKFWAVEFDTNDVPKEVPYK